MIISGEITINESVIYVTVLWSEENQVATYKVLFNCLTSFN